MGNDAPKFSWHGMKLCAAMILEARTSRNMTHTAFADYVGVSKGERISRWESGFRPLNKHLTLLSSILNLDFDQFKKPEFVKPKDSADYASCVIFNARHDLMLKLQAWVKTRRESQTDTVTAKSLNMHNARLSALMNGQLGEFSLRQLLNITKQAGIPMTLIVSSEV